MKANSKPKAPNKPRKRYKLMGDLKGFKQVAQQENERIAEFLDQSSVR